MIQSGVANRYPDCAGQMITSVEYYRAKVFSGLPVDELVLMMYAGHRQFSEGCKLQIGGGRGRQIEPKAHQQGAASNISQSHNQPNHST